MKRFFTLLLILGIFASLNATVKPRHRGSQKTATATEHNEASVGENQQDEANLHAHQGAPLKVGLRSTAPLASMGSPKIPLILVQFSDLKFTSGLKDGNECDTEADADSVNAFFNLFANGKGGDSYYMGHGSRGAIREYFRDQSLGQFTPEFEIIGPITLSKSYAYYGEHVGNTKDKNISEFFSESIRAAQKLESNWDKYDNNADNRVDMAFFLYAGEGENGSSDENTIWPKEMQNGGSINGVSYGCYACCNEVYKGKTDGIGVFIHELSHALGLPDLYDTNYVAYGMDYWSIMDSGCYCQDGMVPCGYSSYEKDFMGWKSLVTLDINNPEHLVLEPISLGGFGYKMVNPENPNEYYVIENRQNKRWDAYIGRGTNTDTNHGLLVTHIDYNRSSWVGNSVNTDLKHQRCTILPADGTLMSYMYVSNYDEYIQFLQEVSGDPFPGSQQVTELTEEMEKVYTTTGNTPGLMNQPLRNIVEHEDGTIELDYCPRGVEPISDGIKAVISEQSQWNDGGVYDLAGRRVATSPNSLLRPGIYIVRGNKVKIGH